MKKPTLMAGSGFALVGALIALALLGVLAVGARLLSTIELRAARATVQANRALYAAEAGLELALARWQPVAAATLRPGATLDLGAGSFSTGAGYRARVTRLDDGGDIRSAYFALRSVGHASGPYGGRREVLLFVRSRWPDGVCCDGAIHVRDRVRLVGGSVVSGFDRTPPPWTPRPAVCRALPANRKPAIVAVDRTRVGWDRTVKVIGAPPVAVWTPGEDPDARTGSTYSALVRAADTTFPAGARVAAVAPRLDGTGACQRTSAGNWGAPHDPAHPCHDYLPIIHAAGDLEIDASGAGQGILLVDGDLAVQGGFRFYGIVIVGGRLVTRGRGVGIHGGVVIRGGAPEPSSVGGEARLNYSGCAVLRALVGSRLNAPRPLARRAWSELFK